MGLHIKQFEQHFLPFILENQTELYSLNFNDSSVFPTEENIVKLYDVYSENAFVIELDGECIGFYLYMNYYSSMILSQIFISKEHRKKGYGKMLMKHFEEELKSFSVSSYQLHVSAINQDAVKFYKDFGCTTDLKYQESNEDRFLMSKEIKCDY